MKYRDKLTFSMAGRVSFGGLSRKWHGGLQRGGALKSCHSEFHRILWCGLIGAGYPLIAGSVFLFEWLAAQG